MYESSQALFLFPDVLKPSRMSLPWPPPCQNLLKEAPAHWQMWAVWLVHFAERNRGKLAAFSSVSLTANGSYAKVPIYQHRVSVTLCLASADAVRNTTLTAEESAGGSASTFSDVPEIISVLCTDNPKKKPKTLKFSPILKWVVRLKTVQWIPTLMH